MNEDLKPRPAVGHMPFKGHRTVATIWAQQASRERCNSPEYKAKCREQYRARVASQYGLEMKASQR